MKLVLEPRCGAVLQLSPTFAVLAAMLLSLMVGACSDKQAASAEQPIRGLRAYKVSTAAETRVRRFPSILQPADVSRLSFEIAGQLKAVTLEAGQKVQLGDVLAEIDPRSLQAQVEQAGAAVKQAEAQRDNANGEFQRRDQLLKKGFATQAAFDQANATLLTANAQLEHAERQLDLANHNLERGRLLAPFRGAIAGVEVKSFGQVSPGQPVVTLYSDDRFEMSFVVPSGIFQSLSIGQTATVRIGDRPDLSLVGKIKELGSKAEQVSAFPVVVRLDSNTAGLNAGMSVEVALEEPLAGGSAKGFLVPLTVIAPEGGKDLQGIATVFRYDDKSATVKKSTIKVGGIRDNRLIVTEGLSTGDVIASAGVSYLVDGQKVKLLPLQE